MFSRQAHFSSDLIKFLQSVSLSNSFGPPSILDLVQKLCIELYRFHLHVCSEKVCAPGKCAVALKKNCIIIWKIFLKVYPESPLVDGVPYSAIGTHPRCDNCLWHDRLCKRNTCNCKRCCINWMSMYNRSYIRSLLIYSHVHLDLRRWSESRVCLDHISFSIYFTDDTPES